MLNKVFLMGRLVADPEAKQTPSGVSVTTFRIAVDRDFKNKQTGEKEADFLNIVAWRSTAEFVSKYFTKGRIAVVEGRIQIRNYTDKDGVKRYVTEIVADNVYFGDSKRDSDGGYAPRASAPVSASSAAYDPVVPQGDQFSALDDDDAGLPFNLDN